MEDIQTIKERIKNRKQVKKENKSFQKVYHLMISFMSLCVVGLSVACVLKLNPDFNVKEWTRQHVLNILPSFQILEVSHQIEYEALDDHSFITSNHQIEALRDGIIQSSSENELVILYDNGIEARYSNIIVSNNNKRIKQGSIIATYEQSFKLDLYKDGKHISYEDFFY